MIIFFNNKVFEVFRVVFLYLSVLLNQFDC